MQIQTRKFKARSAQAVNDPKLQSALDTARHGLVNNRLKAVNVVSEFEAWREKAKRLKQHTLHYLDSYLEQFETNVIKAGGHVHWAANAEEANSIILRICQDYDATHVAKGKSMAGEEIGLNAALEQANIQPIETDLGEYIVQLAEEPPSHIIVPAVHKSKADIIDLFSTHHERGPEQAPLTEVPDLVAEARRVMREKFHQAQVGITGANFLVAETGSAVIVTNEGNGDLSATLPRVHIVTAGIEKVVPDLNSVALLTRLLARSATGQETTAYTSFFTGPKRMNDQDGPEAMHIVLIDNGRTEMLNSELRDMLRCIRCGACLNHCPVYGTVGGHAYGWVYPGPMGSVLSPAILGLEEAGELPNACTLNGRCETVCPVKIPLPKMLRQLRVRQFNAGLGSRLSRVNLFVWKHVFSMPHTYSLANKTAQFFLRLIAGKSGWIRCFPGLSAWCRFRDLCVPDKHVVKEWNAIKKAHQARKHSSYSVPSQVKE